MGITSKEVITYVGMKIVEGMRGISVIERIEQAQSVEEETRIVQETERIVFDVIDDIFKDDSEIGEDGIEVKNKFLKGSIEHQYKFFGLKTPFDEGLTLEDVRNRNGKFSTNNEDEEFFL